MPLCRHVCACISSYKSSLQCAQALQWLPLSLCAVSPLLDALPAALQSPGEAASAEVVHAHVRAGEEEDHQGHDRHGVGTATTLL